MKTAIKAAAAAGLFILTLFPGCAQRQTDEANLRLLYWNIQNGMWSGQGDQLYAFCQLGERPEPRRLCVV